MKLFVRLTGQGEEPVTLWAAPQRRLFQLTRRGRVTVVKSHDRTVRSEGSDTTTDGGQEKETIHLFCRRSKARFGAGCVEVPET